ncbi:peptidase T [Spirochaeta africana]|uniref:Peptidase T n=1 Tax=Spirochaeta africana (strain ATCC 700263 / DSM 8902 / Z-7692) TaxID=889378 RepID=H9UMM8_SPIAZ|nr:peptidase T [Spirochaeta africana]AFG38771.1 peptidase T [Spirochaeta africana DSM 8902]
MTITEVVAALRRERTAIAADVTDRFLRYVQIHTTSDKDSPSIPSTPRQFDLAKVVVQELHDMGVTDVELTDSCYVIARVPGTAADPPVPAMCLMAHFDTSPEASGERVKPLLWENYQGGDIRISGDVVLTPEENPLLQNYRGETVITSSGDTLLGADDKAGLAEILSAVRFLLQHPEIPRVPLELVFTPDEEIGRGLDGFSRDMISANVAYTLDGGEEGELEGECYNGYMVEVLCTGEVIHLGYARGRLVNAVTMAAQFVSMLPRNESPEATDERYGYYAPLEIKADMGSARIEVYLRDFEFVEIERRIEALRAIAAAVEAQFPGGRVAVQPHKQYLNMREAIAAEPGVMERARQAIRDTGIEPVERSIRGGTDGAKLCELGVATPNIFAGGVNFHSVREWVAVPAMVRAVETAVLLARRWAEADSSPAS